MNNNYLQRAKALKKLKYLNVNDTEGDSYKNFKRGLEELDELGSKLKTLEKQITSKRTASPASPTGVVIENPLDQTELKVQQTVSAQKYEDKKKELIGNHKIWFDILEKQYFVIGQMRSFSEKANAVDKAVTPELKKLPNAEIYMEFGMLFHEMIARKRQEKKQKHEERETIQKALVSNNEAIKKLESKIQELSLLDENENTTYEGVIRTVENTILHLQEEKFQFELGNQRLNDDIAEIDTHPVEYEKELVDLIILHASKIKGIGDDGISSEDFINGYDKFRKKLENFADFNKKSISFQKDLLISVYKDPLNTNRKELFNYVFNKALPEARSEFIGAIIVPTIVSKLTKNNRKAELLTEFNNLWELLDNDGKVNLLCSQPGDVNFKLGEFSVLYLDLDLGKDAKNQGKDWGIDKFNSLNKEQKDQVIQKLSQQGHTLSESIIKKIKSEEITAGSNFWLKHDWSVFSENKLNTLEKLLDNPNANKAQLEQILKYGLDLSVGKNGKHPLVNLLSCNKLLPLHIGKEKRQVLLNQVLTVDQVEKLYAISMPSSQAKNQFRAMRKASNSVARQAAAIKGLLLSGKRENMQLAVDLFSRTGSKGHFYSTSKWQASIINELVKDTKFDDEKNALKLAAFFASTSYDSVNPYNEHSKHARIWSMLSDDAVKKIASGLNHSRTICNLLTAKSGMFGDLILDDAKRTLLIENIEPNKYTTVLKYLLDNDSLTNSNRTIAAKILTKMDPATAAEYFIANPNIKSIELLTKIQADAKSVDVLNDVAISQSKMIAELLKSPNGRPALDIILKSQNLFDDWKGKKGADKNTFHADHTNQLMRIIKAMPSAGLPEENKYKLQFLSLLAQENPSQAGKVIRQLHSNGDANLVKDALNTLDAGKFAELLAQNTSSYSFSGRQTVLGGGLFGASINQIMFDAYIGNSDDPIKANAEVLHSLSKKHPHLAEKLFKDSTAMQGNKDAIKNARNEIEKAEDITLGAGMTR